MKRNEIIKNKLEEYLSTQDRALTTEDILRDLFGIPDGEQTRSHKITIGSHMKKIEGWYVRSLSSGRKEYHKKLF